MKGIVFTELLAMAEGMLGETVVDQVIETAALPSGGAYTSVGNYLCSELVTLVGGFSKVSQVAPEDLQRQFGHWMMASFKRHYPDFFVDKTNAFQMLAAIDAEIHVEVLKLYPDAELPEISTCPLANDGLQLTYRSSRPLVHFCKGLVEACLESFDDPTTISMADHSTPGASHAVFALTRC